MKTAEVIATKVFCESHQIELSFIQSLHESGLIEIIMMEESTFVPADQLEQLEKIVRLYFEMGINVEGIETIANLLQRITDMQKEITILKNRLRLYETE